jgi:transposase InsO family protein
VLELRQEKGYSITNLCKAIGISRSGYYKWLDRAPSEQEVINESLAVEIKRVYDESDSTYGVERIKLALERELALVINIKRVRRIIRILGITSVIRRKRQNYVKSIPEHTYENVINRDFTASKPNEKWFTDVTYLKVCNTNVFLSAIIDTYDQSIVAWKISPTNDNQLIKDTLDLAFEANPNAKPYIQTDRGSQYTSGMYREMSLKYGFKISMSRVSKCLDNQPIESFWGTLKSEYYYRKKFDSFESLVNGIESYINRYMHKRYVKKFDGLTPSEFRALAA